MAVVYALIHQPSGYAYIGCTKGDLAKRMREHRCLLNAGTHSATKLQEDWARDGETAFAMKPIETLKANASVVDKRVRELYWMQWYAVKGKLYNLYQVSYAGPPGSIEKAIEAAKPVNAERMKRIWSDPVLNAERSKRVREGIKAARERRMMR